MQKQNNVGMDEIGSFAFLDYQNTEDAFIKRRPAISLQSLLGNVTEIQPKDVVVISQTEKKK